MNHQRDVSALAVAEDVRRPDVLALPSATTSRFILLLVAALAGGAYFGQWLHGEVFALRYLTALNGCFQSAPHGQSTSDVFARSDYLRGCLWPAQATRGLFAILGAALVALLCYLGAAAQQRRSLRHNPGREMTQRIPDSAPALAALCRRAGVADVSFVIGPPGQWDAVTYGVFGHPQVRLPMALAARWRTSPLFEPVVLHELSHVRHRDVLWGQLSRAAWWVIGPLLVLPVVVDLVRSQPRFALDYAWRAALLVIIVQALIRSFLRARELDADLRAAQVSSPAAMAAALDALPEDRPGRTRRSARRLAYHPSAAERSRAVQWPASTVGWTALDGFSAGLLATTAGAVSSMVLTNLLSALVDSASVAELLSSVLTYGLLGFVVGGAMLRLVLVRWAAAIAQGAALRRWGLAGGVAGAVGVGMGTLAGRVASLAHAGDGTYGGVTHAWMLPLPLWTGAAAALLVFAVAQAWAVRSATRWAPRRMWWSFALLATVIFAAAGWVTDRLLDATAAAVAVGGARAESPSPSSSGATLGWQTFRALILFGLPTWTFALTVLAIAVVLAWVLSSRPTDRPPGWIFEGSRWSGGLSPLLATGRLRLATVTVGSACALTLALTIAGRRGGSPTALVMALLGTCLAGSVMAALLSLALVGGSAAGAMVGGVLACASALALYVALSRFGMTGLTWREALTIVLPSLSVVEGLMLLLAPVLAILPETPGAIERWRQKRARPVRASP